jgi:hypothetical protein
VYGVRAERDHRVDHQRDHRDKQDGEQGSDDPGAGRAENGARARPPERTQARRQPGVVGREPLLDFSEHALLVHRQRHTATPLPCAPGEYPLTISQERVFIQLFWLRTSSVFQIMGSGASGDKTPSLRPDQYKYW